MNTKYPKANGALFKNRDKKSDNHPDVRGVLEVSEDQLRMLIAMAKAGVELKMQLAGWNRRAQSGQRYMRLESEAYMPEQRSAARKTPPAAGADDDPFGDDDIADDPFDENDIPF